MLAIIKKPGEEAKTHSIENRLGALQKAVGGNIEVVSFPGFAVVCDEEGRLKGYEKNCEIRGVDFVGTILFVGRGGDELKSLPPSTALKLLLEVNG